MKVTALFVYKCTPETPDPIVLAYAFELPQFNSFYRKQIEPFITFFGRTVATRTLPDQRQTVTHEEYKVHAYNKSGLCVVGFMDDHYPVRSAFCVLDQVLEEYQKRTSSETWRCAKADSKEECQHLKQALEKFQDPAEADKLLRIQRELDETNVILHKTIDSVLARGEKLDSLVEKSSELTMGSKMFYKHAKRTNSCCSIL